MLKKVLKTLAVVNDRKITAKKPAQLITKERLLEAESYLGRQVFGKPDSNVVRREFYNLDAKTWIWHEEIKDNAGDIQKVTIRYEILDQHNKILKVRPGPRYDYLQGAELQNFALAVKQYDQNIRQAFFVCD